jgi:hypothetical protein
MNSTERFTDNNNGTITDQKTGLTWSKEDSWQSDAKWVSWDEAMDHVNHFRDVRFGGTADWRLPAQDEVLSLYDPSAVNTDKYGNEIHLSEAFPSGPLATIWIHEHFTGNEGYILDFKTGEIRKLFKSKTGRMAVRPVTGTMKKSEAGGS